jgi:hypothetical protein
LEDFLQFVNDTIKRDFSFLGLYLITFPIHRWDSSASSSWFGFFSSWVLMPGWVSRPCRIRKFLKDDKVHHSGDKDVSEAQNWPPSKNPTFCPDMWWKNCRILGFSFIYCFHLFTGQISAKKYKIYTLIGEFGPFLLIFTIYLQFWLRMGLLDFKITFFLIWPLGGKLWELWQSFL